MGINWGALHRNIGDIGSSLGEYGRQEKAKADAFQMLLMKYAIEQKIKRANMQGNLELLKSMGFGLSSPEGSVMPGTETPRGENYITQVEPRLDTEGGLSFGFKRELSPEAQLKQKVKETKEIELAKGISPDKAGLYNLAKESIKNIRDVKKILFPTGEAKSYKRWTAYGSNPILSQLPGVPQYFGFRQNTQDVYRKISAALSGRQLIQTGVAARPEETAKLVNQFAPSGMSQSQAALNGLNELEDFYTNYVNTLETRGLKENKGDPLGLR